MQIAHRSQLELRRQGTAAASATATAAERQVLLAQGLPAMLQHMRQVGVGGVALGRP